MLPNIIISGSNLWWALPTKDKFFDYYQIDDYKIGNYKIGEYKIDDYKIDDYKIDDYKDQWL